MTVPTSAAQEFDTVIVAAAGGDKAAFSQLYQQFAGKVYNLVLRSVRNAPAAEDVCQEVWVRAYQKLPELREPAAFTTWLYRIASRACIDRARRPGPDGEEELPEGLAASPHDGPEDAAIRHERERMLWQALGALPVRQHLALFLREVEGLSYQEMSGVLNTTPSAIETLLFRARRGVADAFERLQSATERCGQAQRTMAVLIDGEATLVQRRAVRAHVDECRRCRGELGRFRRTSEAYGFLPLLPLPALLGERILEGLGAASIGTGTGAIGKLLALLTTKAKLTTAALTLTGGMAVATMVVPGDTLPLTTAAASRQPVAAAPAGGAASGSQPAATPAGLLGTPAPTIDVAGLAPVASALDTLRQITEQMGTAFPALPALSETPAAALDRLAGLLTPPAILPGITPPAIEPAPPTVTLPELTPPVALPTVTPPLPLPTLAPPELPLP